MYKRFSAKHLGWVGFLIMMLLVDVLVCQALPETAAYRSSMYVFMYRDVNGKFMMKPILRIMLGPL